MRYRPLIIVLLAAASPLVGCKKKKPTATKKPPGTEAAAEQEKQEDSIGLIGFEVAGLVKLWTLALSIVETEESAESTAKRLANVEEQFDFLVQRAEKLPPLSPGEFKRVDEKVDSLLTEAAAGLEIERKRIFLLPPSIKEQILPTHDRLLEKFRGMSRTISEISRQPAQTPDTTGDETPPNPLDGPGAGQ